MEDFGGFTTYPSFPDHGFYPADPFSFSCQDNPPSFDETYGIAGYNEFYGSDVSAQAMANPFIQTLNQSAYGANVCAMPFLPQIPMANALNAYENSMPVPPGPQLMPTSMPHASADHSIKYHPEH